MAQRGRPARLRPELCSKCQIYPPVAGQNWCPKCFTEHREQQAAQKLNQATAQGYARGIEDMRETLALEFERWGGVLVACAEVASAIRQAPRPKQPAAVSAQWPAKTIGVLVPG